MSAQPCGCDVEASWTCEQHSVHKRLVIERITGNEPLTPNPEGIWPIVEVPLAEFRKQYESLGDCVSCDGYRINPEDGEHCPTCARMKREGKAL